MGVFHVFRIVQMVPNCAKHHIFRFNKPGQSHQISSNLTICRNTWRTFIRNISKLRYSKIFSFFFLALLEIFSGNLFSRLILLRIADRKRFWSISIHCKPYCRNYCQDKGISCELPWYLWDFWVIFADLHKNIWSKKTEKTTTTKNNYWSKSVASFSSLDPISIFRSQDRVMTRKIHFWGICKF